MIRNHYFRWTLTIYNAALFWQIIKDVLEGITFRFCLHADISYETPTFSVINRNLDTHQRIRCNTFHNGDVIRSGRIVFQNKY